MFSITYKPSRAADGDCITKVYDTIEQFDIKFLKCRQGIKNGEGFIRGGLIDNETERCDANLLTAKLLIIDGDSGINGNPTPDPKECYEALIRLGYSFIIYTTHSHTTEKPKYRVIVELSEEIRRHELAANLDRLLDELAAEGINFQRVKEMYVWSQIWYMPRRENAADGLYLHLSNFTGGTFTTLHHAEETATKRIQAERSEPSDVSGQTLAQLVDNILTGKEYHQSMNNLIYQYLKEGMPKALVLATMQGLMNGSKGAVDNPERWLERFNDIERSIEGALGRIEEEENDEDALDVDEIHFDDGQIQTYSRPMPLPPGRTGVLLAKLHDDMMRPSIEVAHISTFSLLAALCGAKFNAQTLKKDGLNMWFLLIAKTGEGKSQVKDFLTHVLVNNMNGNIINYEHPLGSFMMTNPVTTPKVIFNHLAQGRSFVHVMPEAGLNGLEKSGSPKSVLAAQLELFTSSGVNKLANNKHMSDEKDNLKPIRNPAYSMFMESSPDAFSKAAKEDDLFNIGFLPRCTTFMLLAPPKINRVNAERNIDFSLVSSDSDITQQIGKIAKSAAAVQAVDAHTVNLVTFKSVYAEYLDLCDMHNERYMGEQYLHEISTRIVVNIIKLASLVTIFNNWDGEESIEVDTDAWEYAKDFYQWYMENILLALGFMSIKNEFNEAETIIKKAIVQTYKRLKVEMQNGKQIRLNDLLNVLKKNGNSSMLNKIATLTKYMRKPTMEVVFSILEGMQKTGQIKITTGSSEKKKGVKYIQVLSGFNS